MTQGPAIKNKRWAELRFFQIAAVFNTGMF